MQAQGSRLKAQGTLRPWSRSGLSYQARAILLPGLLSRRISSLALTAFWIAVGVYVAWSVMTGLGGPDNAVILTDGTGWQRIPEWLR